MFSKLSFNVDKKTFSRFLLLAPYLIITILLIVIPLILVFIKPFQPTVDSATNESIAISNNWSFLGATIWEKIGLSFLVAIIVTIVCVIIGYAFAYFLSLSKSLPAKIFAISLMTSPMWISFLIKLVGLKEIFDFINGQANSTYGLIYTIIALVYVNLPTFILTIYTFLNTIPKNLLEASKDLGKNCVQTFFQVILPYTKNAVFSGITLIFLPTLTTAGVTQFMDNSNNGELIGSILLDKGLEGTASQIALARVATLSLVVCLIILVLWSIAVLIPKSIKHYKKMKKENLNA
ncbi:MAG: ABC transporter permease subunit [Malacoplasma sp.]|nr:ABC transporter permease subunit [Malacoplasma sp.]MDE7075015.1 ABC transporter permease subunit [Malacoplasma sp.]